ncbi:hypothetical protein V1264_003686 [Littorina saxatilis]|uniref:Guanylate cyclase n=1 Tax=Littorina saxatilis TaxID=31220 RepID=A0AAN9B6K7_9CAEN
MNVVSVIILSVPWLSMRRYMLVAHELGMTSGEFVFICINSDVYTRKELQHDVQSDRVWRRNDTDNNAARTAFEAVIYVMLAQAEGPNYHKFETLVDQAENVTVPRWELPRENTSYVDAYAPFLYDATSIWAILVNRSLENHVNPRNGTLLFREARTISTMGLTGPLELDQNADRQMNNWFLDMGPDGHFRICVSIVNKHKGGGVQTPDKIRWPDGTEGEDNAPPDTPVCGFEGELCTTEEEHSDDPMIFASIGGSIGATAVIIAAITVNCYFRHQRNKQKWAGMMWQVKMAEVDFLSALLCDSVRSSFRTMGRRKSSMAAKKLGKLHDQVNAKNVNFMDPAHASFKAGSDVNGGNTFGSVCYYKGSIVSVKRVAKLSLSKDLISQFNHLLDLKCQNVTPFLGCIMDNDRHYMLLWEYCAKGSLQDIIFNTNIKLDKLFKFALCQDVAKGLDFLHKHYVGYHGNLKSSNCVVDSRWTCKLTDFGVHELRQLTKAKLVEEGSSALYERDLWTAPEVLRGEVFLDQDKRQADVFSLGVVMKEVFTRTGPYSEFTGVTAKEIIEKVKYPNCGVFRPTIPSDLHLEVELTSLIFECWAEDASLRPLPGRVLKSLNRINPNKHNTVIDNMLAMLEKYANHLEELVAERTSELDAEKKKTEKLLYRMLPQTVAEDLKLGKPVKAELFDEVTIYFSDIVGFTKICAESTPIEVVNLLNSLYTLFDDIITAYDVYKVETIGDAYMLASGLPKRNGNNHIREIADVSLDIMSSIDTFCIPHLPDRKLHIRIGIHTGSVVAGVVGLAMPRYCLFGDAVNTASRMESTGLPMKIHLSHRAYEMLRKFSGYHVDPRGEITVKGKGSMFTFFLVGKDGFHKHLPTNSDYKEPPPLLRRPTTSQSCNNIPQSAASRVTPNDLQQQQQPQDVDEDSEGRKMSDTSGQRVRNTSTTSDIFPVINVSQRRVSVCSVHLPQPELKRSLNAVDVKSLRKTFEDQPSICVVSGGEDAADASGDMDTVRRKLDLLYSAEGALTPEDPAPVESAHDSPSMAEKVRHKLHVLFNLDDSCDKLSRAEEGVDSFHDVSPTGGKAATLNNSVETERKRDNGSLERERQLLQHQQNQHQQQFPSKLEEPERRTGAVHHLERLFINPKTEALTNLDITANIFTPITQGIMGIKRSDSDAQSRLAHARAMTQLYKEPKQANTEHRNSPQNSRPSSPKPDVAILKEQMSTRLHQRGMELTTSL